MTDQEYAKRNQLASAPTKSWKNIPLAFLSGGAISPAMEFKSEGIILGLGAKMFVIAGPVIVYGIAASVVYGLILWLARL